MTADPVARAKLQAELQAELQQLLDRLGALVGKLVGAEPAKRSPPLRVHPSAKLWPYKGEQLTLAQLAALAGIKPTAMRERLVRLSPEAAVGQGQSRFQRGELRTWRLDGQDLTVTELAARAGVSHDTMRQRLRRHPAEVAVSFGRMPRGVQAFPRRAKGPRKPIEAAAVNVVPTQPPRAATPAPTAAPTPAPTPAPTRRLTPAPTAAPEVITPANVKRTVAKAPPGRFEVHHAPSTFGRIGQYEDTGSAVAQQYGGKRG